VLADDRSALVPIPNPLFSQMNITGRSHSLAMLYASNSCPWLAAPSPYTAMQRSSVPKYFSANATPAPSGT